MEIVTIPFNSYLVNTYIAFTEKKEALIIDPACADLAEKEKLTRFIADENLALKYIILTHGHVDHIAGCEFVKQQYPDAVFVMHRDAFPIYHENNEKGGFLGFKKQNLPDPDLYVEEGDTILLGKESFLVLDTPGHSPGSICLYNEKHHVVFTGDVLFFQSIGRTDLTGGSFDVLTKNIRTKLLTLPPETKVFPGHGDPTDIYFETQNNPYLY